MKASHADRVAELFKSALERSPETWPSFLEEQCSDNADLRADVESLLKFKDRGSAFLEESALELTAESFLDNATLRPGEKVADYAIVSRLASGGMGDVYLAEETKLGRRVAIKLVQRGMHTAEIVRRFRHEEQILAGLNHANIAHLYGGGLTSDTTPYFVMEYVEGMRIDVYCSEKALSTSQRLALFRKVCAAVQYAHQHLVVHRDIKPSNILVTEEGEPKLLDFGIAKLTDPNTLPTNQPTITIAHVMTPEYASPEQVRGETITTASDIYSLGVLLYELLTGTRPHRLRSHRTDDIVRAISCQDPPRPSTAAAKSLSPPGLVTIDPKTLRGDLDNIVLKAMRQEPTRRYVSAAQFSDDIRRYLDGMPVVARRDTFVYRTSKFVGRHKVYVATACTVLAALTAGVISFAWEAKLASAQRDKALLERNKAERLSAFLDNVFLSSDPNSAFASKQGRKVTLEEAVDDAGRRAEAELTGQPEALAKLQGTIGYSYLDRGQYELAEHYLKGSVENYRRVFGEDTREVVDARHLLGALWLRTGRYSEVEPVFRRDLEFYRKATSKAGNRVLKPLVDKLSDLAYVLRLQGSPAAAESLHREALLYAKRLNGEERASVAISLAQLGLDRYDQGALAEAEKLVRQAIAEFQTLPGGEHLDLANALGTLCVVLKTSGKYAEAEVLIREAMNLLSRFVGESYPAMAAARNELAELLFVKGETVEAQRLAEENLALARRTLPAGHVTIAMPLNTLGLILTRTGHPNAAEAFLREALALREKTFKQTYWRVGASESALGECLTAETKFTEGEPHLLKGYERLEESVGKKDPRSVEALQRIVVLYEAWQKPGLAEKVQGSP